MAPFTQHQELYREPPVSYSVYTHLQKNNGYQPLQKNIGYNFILYPYTFLL